ncbi:MAG TPA: type III-B CRISPR module RAMP protein Cmr1 [Candidatus Fraserbacteria bacterium]|nr:type III-B CRISPR module RAMP protein Cmr1 [Candidatus Fraserbacteria bacterium]
MKLKTLTPLWTGGVKGTCDRLHETGIIGSLRWWYEALVRGLGGSACDPSRHECSYDPKKPHDGLCDVCRVFGATGWRRQFRLEVLDHALSNASIEHTIRADRTYTDNKGRTRAPTWYFRDPNRSQRVPNTPKHGELSLKIQALSSSVSPEVIAGLIQFIADWVAVGARTQMGFGVVELANGRIDTEPLHDWLSALAGTETNPKLPSLQNAFFARIASKNGATEQETFNLKYDLRRLFAEDRNLRHFVMGTVRGKRLAAKIKMSRPYGNGLIRVWGWIPREADVYGSDWERNTVVELLHQHLKTRCTLQVWREFNSPRDTTGQEYDDPTEFLKSLLVSESS